MRFFSSELGSNYDTYTFGYTNYCVYEPGDSLTDIYARGYLPYSGSPTVTDTFYMARSARVELPSFSLSSENRRIAKKFDGTFQKKRIPFTEFTITDEVITFCSEYFKNRHGEHAMPKARLENILRTGSITTIVEYKRNNTLAGYVFEIEAPEMRHYWYSFYDVMYADQSLGMWMMLDCIRDAHEAGLSHYYLGTVYGAKALYKTNFAPLSWWSGEAWEDDLATLKERGRSDKEERTTLLTDMWKRNTTLF